MRACKERSIRSLVGNDSLESLLTREARKTDAPQLAEEQFPVGSYTRFTAAKKDNYGIISRIDASGNIYVKTIQAKEEKEEGRLKIFYKRGKSKTEIKFTPWFSEAELTWRSYNRYSFSLLRRLYEHKEGFLYEKGP